MTPYPGAPYPGAPPQHGAPPPLLPAPPKPPGPRLGGASPPLHATAEMPEYGVAPPLQHPPDPVRPPARQPWVGGPPEHMAAGAPMPIHDVYAAPIPPMPEPPAPWTPMNAQAVGQMFPTEQPHAHTLGLSMLAVAAGLTVGAKLGGLPGGAAGVLFAGSAVNTWRALSHFRLGTDADDREGRVSALYALVGAAGGGLLWWRYVSPQRMHANPDDDDDDDDRRVMAQPPCGIRPAGP